MAARKAGTAPTGATVDAREVEQFSALADHWWDDTGPFAPLHRFTPVRVAFIRDRLSAHFGIDDRSRPLAGLRILDIGCGGGLLSEPMCRLGAEVTGVDASVENAAAARAHAEMMGLAIDYRADAAENLAAAGERYDAVVASEVVEHVADLDAFTQALGTLLRPGGALVMTTLNRTLLSLALGKFAAEYLLRWVPAGTHDWRKFVTPSELSCALETHGLRVTEVVGISYDPLAGRFHLSGNDQVNYALFATRD